MAYDPTKDRYPVQDGPSNPGTKAEAVTLSDSNDVYYRFLYVGVGGDLIVTPMRNTADAGVLYKNVPVGWFPVAVRRVWSTGTTATNVVGHLDV